MRIQIIEVAPKCRAILLEASVFALFLLRDVGIRNLIEHNGQIGCDMSRPCERKERCASKVTRTNFILEIINGIRGHKSPVLVAIALAPLRLLNIAAAQRLLKQITRNDARGFGLTESLNGLFGALITHNHFTHAFRRGHKFKQHALGIQRIRRIKRKMRDDPDTASNEDRCDKQNGMLAQYSNWIECDRSSRSRGWSRTLRLRSSIGQWS